MEEITSPEGMSFFARIGMAFRLIFRPEFARLVTSALKLLEAPKAPPPPPPPPERLHASGLVLLNALQRECRLVDFLQQDIASFSDQDVGAAARVVHSGCRKVIQEFFELDPATKDAEGETVTVPKGFDAQRTRLTGNVAGQPPFRGTLKHHGWVVREVRMPALAEAMDPRIIAPAEVELG